MTSMSLSTAKINGYITSLEPLDLVVASVGFEPLRRTFGLGAIPGNAFSLGISLYGPGSHRGVMSCGTTGHSSIS